MARLEPDLAESWTASPDGLTWTFRLRRGVKFHHGFGELTADDVVHSLKRAADAKRSNFAVDYAEFGTVEAVDPATVRIVLTARIPSVLGVLADYHGGYVVSRRADEAGPDAIKNRPVGTGPFAFDAYEPKASTTLVAFREHFRGSPRLGKVVFRYINSDQTRELAFTAGELDLAHGRREQRWVERMRGQPGAVVEVFQPGEFRTLLINAKMAPLGDLRVRQAIAHAVDVPSLIRFVGADIAIPGRSVVPQGYLGETPDVPRYPYDPEKAKALLAAAGLANGFAIRSVASSIPTQLPIMEQVQAQLKKVGIALELDVVDHPTYHARIRQDLSALTFYGAARFPVADTYLTQFYHSRSAMGAAAASLNFAHCAAADAEIDAARSEADQARQLALWAEAQRKIMAAACSVPLYDLLQVWVRSAKVDYGYKLEGALSLGPPVTERTRVE
jgi:peptide/nickel transport system substrate-binding protein